MRLIHTYTDQRKAFLLSSYLKQQNIPNDLEVTTNTDWGSAEYGNTTSRIWVVDEDDYEKALPIMDEFEKNPQDPKYSSSEKKPLFNIEPLQSTLKNAPKKLAVAKEKVSQPFGMITLYNIVICTIIFFYGSFTSPAFTETHSKLPLIPLYSAPIYKAMYYDYPQDYSLTDKLIATYGMEKVVNQDLPPTGQNLVKEIQSTPYWEGVYQYIVHYFKNEPMPPMTPLFEKIKEGEFWRAFTPAWLHSDILHLFFNMIWLIVLGRQMESRLRSVRFIAFIILTGVITNTAQYLMSGPNFIGFSGILCAMLTFIWIRQRNNSWEGYNLQNGTLGFMLFFIFTVALLQITSFVLEINNQSPIGIPIANTAHITGLIAGYILGKLNFFSWQ